MIANLPDARGHHHVVGVYHRDEQLTAEVARFVAETLEQGGVAVVVSTAAHRHVIDAGLLARGVALESAITAGRYQAIDAADTLRTFMRDGRLDRREFASVAGAMLDRVQATGRPVRIFGEMVGLLWDEGNVLAAIELESLWNDLAKDHRFALFCAYAMSSLETSADLAAVRGMCDCHASVFPLPEVGSEVAHPVVVAGRDDYDRMFVGSPATLRDVRRFVRDVMYSWGEAELGAVIEVLVSELATNAVQHARSPFRVSISREPAFIRVAVRDTSFSPPEQVRGDTARLGGRGVRLVDALSESWGTHDEPDGKTVWAEVARAPRA
jgi:anti-sigma regulatory factor (Ser/Thr protein kinase)